MEETANSLMDRVVQYSANSGPLAAAALGYRVLSSIVGVSPSSSSSDLEKEDAEEHENNNNSNKVSNIITKEWFWSSKKTSPKQYSANGLDKESGLPLFTLQDVSFHDMADDCWMILYDRVYDITCFLDSQEHPGGDDVMLEYAGHDATIAFRGVGHSRIAEESLKPYLIGILVESERIWTRFFNMKSDVP